MRSRLVPALALALSPLAAAQELSYSGGVLGKQITYTVTGNPGALYALVPSFQTGPTPLALIDPGNPGLLQVGIDLSALWTFGNLFGGTSSTVFPLPTSAALHGMPLYAQAVYITLAPSFFGAVSNRVDMTLGLGGESELTLGSPHLNRLGQTMTALEDGRVLLAAGADFSIPPSGPLTDTLEVYDPQTESFELLSSVLPVARTGHVAVELADGRVLILGGADSNAMGLKNAEVFDPATDSVTAVAPMLEQRALPVAVLLSDGRVFVSGGAQVYDQTNLLNTFGSATQKTEIYDPVANTWSPGPDLPQPRLAHGGSLLPDGRVLLTGGLEVQVVFGVPFPTVSDDCRLYDPSGNTLAPAAPLPQAGGLHAQITRSTGEVYVAGGATVTFPLLAVTPFNQVYSYSPAVDAWTVRPSMNVARGYLGLFETQDRLWAIGGVSGVVVATSAFTPSVAVESLGDPLQPWTQHGNMVEGRDLSTTVLLEDLERLFTAGTISPEGANMVINAEAFYLP